jgi:hypothetical protein
MSSLDFSDLLSLAQTVAIIGALLITLYFSRRQIATMEVDLETRVLNDLDEKFHRMGEMFIERPQLVSTIYTSRATLGPEVPFAYYVMAFCAHIFHMRERHILQDNEWAGWLAWMQNAFRHGNVGRYWKDGDMGTWFDPAFRDFVDQQLLGQGNPVK